MGGVFMTQGWPLKSIYLYLVCFVTLLMIVFGFISFLHNTARLVFPVDYAYRQTLMNVEAEYLSTNRPVPPVAELEQIRDSRLEKERANERVRRLRDLLGSFAVWLIPVPFYLFHWRKVKEGLFAGEGGISA
jgi:hypothetical protein